LGEEVALSFYGGGRARRRNVVAGIRTPKGGVDKDGIGNLVFSLILSVFGSLLTGLLLGGVAAALGVALAGQFGWSLVYGLVPGVAVFLACALTPFRTATKLFRVWAAL
jgi:hypothetical protein